MFLAILTLITALAISAVAIYYSVAGLVAIFAAAAIPIMIMGGVLEVSKLVTAVWLHKYWKQATWWLKSYLSIAVIVLMFITSMGIFGFLSKAHIEQTSASEESVARVETLQSEIDRQLGIVGRAENRVRALESSETGADANVQEQIDKEQERIESAYTRIQPAIDEQNAIIANVTSLFQTELDKIDNELAILQGYVDNNEVKKAQQMIGASADGVFGKKTAEKIGDWKDVKKAERAEWLTKIQESANSATVKAARTEIARLRDNADKQIAQSNVLINRLRDQLGDTQNQDDIQKAIDEQFERVRIASSEIETLSEQKITLESEYRKLEAEVGPIKYIAEFVYGEQADKNMLEEAVRWVIVIIIFVFDPLAVLLLIAAQYTFDFRRKELEDDNGERLRLERQEFERARAQRIVDNVPPPSDPIKVPEETEEIEVPVYVDIDQETIDKEFAETTTLIADDEITLNEDVKQDIAREYSKVEPQKKSLESSEESSNKDIPDTVNRMFYPEELESKTYVMKEDGQQVTKETTVKSEGYIQNEEQQDGSIWNTLKNSK